MSTRILLALALVTLPASLAAAESTTSAARVETFDDELVPGEHYDPDGGWIHSRRRAGRRSLVRTRENFHPEMLESVEDL